MNIANLVDFLTGEVYNAKCIYQDGEYISLCLTEKSKEPYKIGGFDHTNHFIEMKSSLIEVRYRIEIIKYENDDEHHFFEKSILYWNENAKLMNRGGRNLENLFCKFFEDSFFEVKEPCVD